jgi:hypothetical protein
MTKRCCLDVDETKGERCGWPGDEEGADDHQAVRQPTNERALCDEGLNNDDLCSVTPSIIHKAILSAPRNVRKLHVQIGMKRNSLILPSIQLFGVGEDANARSGNADMARPTFPVSTKKVPSRNKSFTPTARFSTRTPQWRQKYNCCSL